MTSETVPPHRRWHAGWWLLGFALAACAWVGWREYDYRAAVREAEAAGFRWWARDSIETIRANWRAAFRRETWDFYRSLELGRVADLTRLRPLLLRLRPTHLGAKCMDTNLDALRGLTGLQVLYLSGCTGLQNVDGLRGLTGLHGLHLYDCTGLQNVDGLHGLAGLRVLDLSGPGLKNVDGLRGLTGLQKLNLSGCTGLQNVDGLRGLTGLQSLGLSGCTGLQNVDGLRGLTGLQEIYLRGCTAIPPAALRELRAALPQADITFPDGSKAPPP